MGQLSSILSGHELDGFEGRRERLTSQGVPDELAERLEDEGYDRYLVK